MAHEQKQSRMGVVLPRHMIIIPVLQFDAAKSTSDRLRKDIFDSCRLIPTQPPLLHKKIKKRSIVADVS